MKTYKFDCRDISISDNEICFSADPMPLDQNCDVVEIYKTNYLRLFYDDGSKMSPYSPAFDFLYIDSENQRVDIYISPQNIEEGFDKNYFEMISIYLKNSELLFRLEKVFAFNKMISADEFFWLKNKLL